MWSFGDKIQCCLVRSVAVVTVTMLKKRKGGEDMLCSALWVKPHLSCVSKIGYESQRCCCVFPPSHYATLMQVELLTHYNTRSTVTADVTQEDSVRLKIMTKSGLGIT